MAGLVARVCPSSHHVGENSIIEVRSIKSAKCLPAGTTAVEEWLGLWCMVPGLNLTLDV